MQDAIAAQRPSSGKLSRFKRLALMVDLGFVAVLALRLLDITARLELVTQNRRPQLQG